MATTSILAVHGLERVGQDFLRALAAMADRHGWNADGIAAVISHESAFDPAAHNPQPGQTATGLIQFIESTAHTLGTTTASLARMSALQQLPYVEKFFATTLRTTVPADPADYILATYGRADLVGKTDGTVIDRKDADDPKERQRYAVNSALDAGQKGYISVGDLRHSARTVMTLAGGRRVTILRPVPGSSSPPSSASGGELLAVLFLWFLLTRVIA